MIKISQEQLFSFAKKHNLIEPGLKKNREQLLLNFVKTIRSMDKETYEKAKYIEVNREKFTKDEAMILVMLVKNIQAYNDFCEGEYLSSKKHKSSGSLRKLFHEAIRYKDVNEFLLNYPLLTQRMEILEKLETFRTYFASPVEKEQYDEWKRKVEPCYRKTRAYIGSEALEAYLKKDEDPDLLFQFMIRYQYTSIMTIKEYISQYLPFCKTDVQQQYLAMKNEIPLLSVYDEFLKKWYLFLQQLDIKKTPNYKAQFLLMNNIKESALDKTMKYAKNYRANIYDQCMKLIALYDQIVIKQAKIETDTLSCYYRLDQSYLFPLSTFTILDFYALTSFSHEYIQKEVGFDFSNSRAYETLQPMLFSNKSTIITKEKLASAPIRVKTENNTTKRLTKVEKDAIINYVEQMVFPRELTTTLYQEIASELLAHPQYLENYSKITKVKK